MILSTQQVYDGDAVYPRWCKAPAYLVFIVLGLDCDESLRRLGAQESAAAALADPVAVTGPAPCDLRRILLIIVPLPDLPGTCCICFRQVDITRRLHSVLSYHVEQEAPRPLTDLQQHTPDDLPAKGYAAPPQTHGCKWISSNFASS